MRKMRNSQPRAAAAAAALFLLAAATVVQSIGVNYGTKGDNLPPPNKVAQFLKDKTIIDRIRIFDADPDILRAFANTGILVAVTIPNGKIPALNDVGFARSWIEDNVKPFYPATKINYIHVGTEVLHWGPQSLIDNLVPALWSVHQALLLSGIHDIKVTTGHSLAIIEKSEPPSMAKFRAGWDKGVLAPLLKFHNETKSPFVVNPYPYFGYNLRNADRSTFRPNKGLVDPITTRVYFNQFELLLDAVYISMMKLGYNNVEVVAGETGWSSRGEDPKCTVENAAAYNGGVVKKYGSGRGTPLFPRKRVETYIFGLFKENLKPGPEAERNFGLFRPDFTPVYNAGIMKGSTLSPTPQKPTVRAPGRPSARASRPPSAPAGKKWCVAKKEAKDEDLQKALDYACSHGIECKPIRAGGSCFLPNTVRAHASFAMNSYYQKNGRKDVDCDFSDNAFVTLTDPSTRECKYIS